MSAHLKNANETFTIVILIQHLPGIHDTLHQPADTLQVINGLSATRGRERVATKYLSFSPWHRAVGICKFFWSYHEIVIQIRLLHHFTQLKAVQALFEKHQIKAKHTSPPKGLIEFPRVQGPF